MTAAERRLSPPALAVANTLFAFLIFALFALQLRLLWDTDSYLHPAIARHYRLHGIFDPPPWGRFSMTSFGGDKDLLRGDDAEIWEFGAERDAFQGLVEDQ